MFDFRDIKIIDLSECRQIHPESLAYIYTDEVTLKKYVIKYYETPTKSNEIYLINEFKKLVLLSGEPEIANVFGLITIRSNNGEYLGYLMDFIEGKNLKDYLQSPTYNYHDYVEILLQLSLGLEKSHHYEVFHNDLRLENIMIDSLKYLKIIDFLWNDFEKPNEHKFKNDVAGFKNIENKLFDQLTTADKKRANPIHKVCQGIEMFKNLSKSINILDKITLELSLLSKKAIDVISKIVTNIPNDFRLAKVMRISEIEIPDFLSPEITE